jgi:hypothetical protein
MMNATPDAATTERLTIELGGVAFPDWSAVTSEMARRALDAIFAIEDTAERWAGLDAAEDRLRRAVLAGYLATGRAPSLAELAAATGIEDPREPLARLAARDLVVLGGDGATVTGAYPFTDRHSGHQVDLGDLRINAMCAIDALGIGALSGHDIIVHSACAACGAAVRVATARRGAALQLVSPKGAMVWLGVRYEGGCAADSLCRSIAFFCSGGHLEGWRAANHPGLDGFRLTMDEALETGRALFAPMLG